ncbi:M23 family metallopeptidase [Pseudaestuariivita atlantica]|uniref:LysM domain-containing protein n=1 Tax=Pseudaestuariivita atlantica TaxID=1317121 RepID=A0A0L1JKZ2_9RHOB|nr:M23 family metallopeptidase [Pseudaestuariivita atlantica]KNG92421.1 hypothetical protein ATO11_17580 [Pseudaestuariivita atlantica]
MPAQTLLQASFSLPHPRIRTRTARLTLASISLAALVACGDQPLDFDLRGKLSNNRFDTSEAARNATIDRPAPDSRGVISYPTYQVAVARRGDTLRTLATRVGADVNELARFNGVKADATLRKGEVVALPRRVPDADTSALPQADGVDVTELASGAIESAAPTPVQTAALGPVQTGPEPTRHKVERGETAYTIARLYGVPVRSLGEWNGLGPDYAIREGQFLLIPVVDQSATPASAPEETPKPGTGSPTPTPPSAIKPLPKEPDITDATKPPSPDLAATVTPQKTDAAMVYPVTGSIIRAYSKGKNDGIDIAASAGTPVKAAQGGTVGHVTSTADQAKFIVIKHSATLLTVYLNVDGISVKKGDKVSAGQTIAKVADTSPSFLHFEVREGTDSVDPALYLE